MNQRRIYLPLATLTGALMIAGTASATTPEQACKALMANSTDKVVLSEAKYVAEGAAGEDPAKALTGASGAGASLPAHCMVRGEIEPRTGADGNHFGIRFEVRMPENWQHRLIFQGGGGVDGFLANAIGSIPIHGSTADPALSRGYAVVSMDGGHPKPTPEFANDQQAKLDFAYAAIGKVTTQAKMLMSEYYRSSAQHTYFMGCSNGGREAMMAAQRYPLEFDGIVAGNPGFHLSRAAVGEAWDTKTFTDIAPKNSAGKPVLANAFSNADLKLVSDGVLAACDELDGIKDGIINNYKSCHFEPKVLQCKAGKDDSCLSKAQVSALEKVFKGAHNSKGEALYSSWPYDAGISAPNWRSWKLGTSQDADKPNALNADMGAASLKGYFMTPPHWDMDTLAFDFDNDIAKLAQTGAINDATSTYMNTFEARGGKLLVVEGLSDPVFSADDIMSWFDQLQQDTNGGDQQAREKWARLFLVPGMTHCGGGPAMDNFDPLAAIQHWVEDDQVPHSLKATGKSFPGKSQPICSYPATAHYIGGNPDKFSSYQCK